MSNGSAGDWARSRREAADEHLAALNRRKSAETAKAREIVRAFVADAVARHLPTTRLKARALNGSATYRTQVEGWYVRRNATIGIGTDGEFYVLSAPGGVQARVRGVMLRPTDPPLVVGAGGRDGESVPLDELLAARLETGWSLA